VPLEVPPPKGSRPTCNNGSQVPPVLFTLIRTFLKTRASGPQNPGLIILEHELSTGSVQAFMTAFPLFKQYNWNLQSVASMNGSAYQNVNGNTAAPTLVPLTAGGYGGAGLLAATTSPTSSSTSTPPSPTTSSEAGRASASPASGAKKNGAASGLRSSSLAGVLSVALALSVCLS
jgi:chitin deacetylase